MILTEDVGNSKNIRFFFFNDPTDTEAHQVQTLCCVQPLYRQVRPPLSLGGQLRGYVSRTADSGGCQELSWGGGGVVGLKEDAETMDRRKECRRLGAPQEGAAETRRLETMMRF